MQYKPLFLVFAVFWTISIVSGQTNICSINPCLNGGACIVSQFSNTFTCSCTQYYFGTRCEHMNRCSYQSALCRNGGTCIPGLDGAFSCRCPISYTGVYCETFSQTSTICSSMPCRNSGTCVAYNNNANYYCQCPQDYSGSTCTTPVTICPVDYCKNNGQCTFDYTLNRLRCACPGTFGGQYCEIPIGQSNACASFPCHNDGSCTPAPPSFLCKCKDTYSGNQCQYSSNSNCYAGFCSSGGTCYSNGNTLQCICPNGYSGIRCETQTTSSFTLCDLNPNLSYCSINCSPGYCFSNPASQPPFACYCTDKTIQLNSCY
ncbi:unnamed protein product [Adineta steineri]|uniref:EGF-like domain-containing protein n=1 Tax=Adineta steineri TaxID=433720 RepID=A0A814EBW7_9BILA|nr:unnamed protein product [Adineta steineri]